MSSTDRPQASHAELVRERSAHRRDPLERFFSHVVQDGTCWRWVAAIHQATGYGAFRADGRTWLAHRFSYTAMVDDIPAGLTIDHLCSVRACVNPDHLDPVPARVNAMRGNAPGILTHKQGVCRRGHSMVDAYKSGPGGKWRTCRACARASDQARRAK